MSENKRYWKSLSERDADGVFLEGAANEFAEFPVGRPPDWSRRGFLKATGFAFAGAALTGCQRAPVQHAVPYAVAPEEITPGRALYYASTCLGCSAGCGVLAKTRDGRPIKLEGNPEHPVSKGGLCAAGQASLLGLYDRQRLLQPRMDSQAATWEQVDRAVRSELERIRREGGAVRFLTGTITSPTTRAAIRQFVRGFADAKHVTYDAISCSAILDAHRQTHGTRLLPHYRLDRAEVIVSFDADFLGTWISPVEFTAAYAARRRPPVMSYHVQVESRLSLTGSKADRRVVIAPEETGLVMTHLAAHLARQAGAAFAAGDLGRLPVPEHVLADVARRLWESRGRSVVLCGSQDVHAQILCNFVNHLLGNYGATVDIEWPSFQRQGNDAELEALLREIRERRVAALFIHRCNPLFDLPDADLAEALRRVSLVVSFAERLDETARAARFVCPDHHYLESWSDAEAVAGTVSLTQPAMQPLGQTRALLESLAAWTGRPKPAYEQIREYWQAHIFPRHPRQTTFQAFWDRTLHDGHAEVRPERVSVRSFDESVVCPITAAAPAAGDTFSLVLYPKVGMPDGSHAYNPWLQELPDPISKVTWDNYVCLSPAAAKRLNISEGDIVRLQGEAGGARAIELPAYVQPGQHDGTLAVALGYGSVLSERFANIGPQWLEARPSVGNDGKVGVNAAPLVRWRNHERAYATTGVRITKVNRRSPLACTQTHHSINVPRHLAPAGQERRPIIQETTLQALREAQEGARHGGEPYRLELDMWPEDHPVVGHRWGMVVDLNACTGCSACVVACQIENNTPVVGKDEVRRQREMHWLRIDRYYAGDGQDVEVAHQPMLCHHCGNAPCETVCPVLATVHSSEGLNQQVYNRCVGTRYCANNCPYKVRRFNWFAYPHDDARENLVLNPDVTVRTRGVMEKCTFCVQRIQEAKLEARRRGVALRDEDLQTACQQSCPAGAITFGDLNNPHSRVAQLVEDPRRYRVLEELNVRPAVTYLKVVRRHGNVERASFRSGLQTE